MLLRFSGFAGANLALHPLLLPDGVGVDSRNNKPGRGDLRPWGASSTTASVAAATKTIYRMGRTAPSDTAYWLAWSTDVDVARGFIAEDTAERTFWTGDGVPKWTDNSIGLGAPPYPDSSGVRLLGVPQPNAAPTLTETVAGTGTDETRAYVITWVNDHDEESMPKEAAATITTKPGSTIQVTRNATVPTGAYGLTKWRVYRTLADNENDYYYVGEATAATATLNDTGSVNTASPLLSETWAMPPSNLVGLKALWNGMMVGFVGKSLRFSEPFRPFAWPLGYELIIDDDIIGLGRWRQQLVVLTVGQPYLVTGSNPGSMSVQLIEMQQACVAKRGIVEFGHGVAWPSPDGLAYMGDAGARLLTAGVALREDWQLLVPSTFIAGSSEGLYVGSYNPGSGRKSLVIDPLNPSVLNFCDTAFDGCYRDAIDDAFFTVTSAGAVQKWDAGSALTVSFESKTALSPKPTCFAFGQIIADSYPVTLDVWAQGVHVVSARSIADGKPFRMPSGFLADQWRIKVANDDAVQAVLLAHSSEELNAT